MYTITEVKKFNENYYVKKYKGQNEKNSYEQKIDISKTTLEKDNYNYIILYDENMNVVRDAYRYLNIELRNLSINSRDSIATGLKLFYTYLKLFKLDISNLNRKSIVMMKEFLYGISKKGRDYTFEFETRRGSNTVNKYIGYYRNYLKYLGIENEVLSARRTIGVEKGNEGLLGHTVKKHYDKYTISEKTYVNSVTVPMYIENSEFNNILESIKNKYDLREEIIVRLMYENGMRIGEVLGLTIEDIGDDRLFIRNRLTDKTDQFAKTCFTPKSIQDYKHTAYNTWKVGYQIVKPSLFVLDKIEEYVDTAHGIMTQKCRGNYLIESKADTVTEGEMLEDGNFYLFLNKDGKPLGVGGWNKILRKIFNEVGIRLDKGVRAHNLSHRFRHGFAMKRVREGASPIEVANDLRHTGLSSVMCYFRPTEDDTYDANKFGEESMIKNITSLNLQGKDS